jgi:hypothetical protein
MAQSPGKGSLVRADFFLGCRCPEARAGFYIITIGRLRGFCEGQEINVGSFFLARSTSLRASLRRKEWSVRALYGTAEAVP